MSAQTQTKETAAEVVPMNQPQAKRHDLVTVDNSQFSLLLDTAKFEHMWRVAQLYAKCGMLPKQYANKPEACFAACQMAIRLQIDPLMFLTNTFPSPNGGLPSMYGKLVIALVNTNGPFTGPIQYELSGKDDARQCRAYATHAKTGELCEMVVSKQTAIDEGWAKNNPKWRTMTDMMLRYRSAAWLVRVYAPECIMGMQTTEEVEDIQELREDADGTYRPAPPAPQRADYVEAEQVEAQTVDEPADAETIETNETTVDASTFAWQDEDGEVHEFDDAAAAVDGYIERLNKMPAMFYAPFWDDNEMFRNTIAAINPDGAELTQQLVEAYKAKAGS